MGKRPDFEYHVGKWLKYDRSGYNSSHPSLGSPWDLGNPCRPLAALGDPWRHAWKCLKMAHPGCVRSASSFALFSMAFSVDGFPSCHSPRSWTIGWTLAQRSSGIDYIWHCSFLGMIADLIKTCIDYCGTFAEEFCPFSEQNLSSTLAFKQDRKEKEYEMSPERYKYHPNV